MEHTSLPMKLRVLRAERQLSLREASARTGVDKVALSRYERGLGRPQDLTLAKIAKGYGVGVEELLEEAVPAMGKAEAPPGESRRGVPEPDSLDELLERRGARTRYLADKNLSDTLEQLPEEDVLQVAREVREEREALAEDRARLNEEFQRNPRNREAFRLLSELVEGSLRARFAIATRMGQEFERVELGTPEAEGVDLEAEGAEQDLRDAAALVGVGSA